MQAPAPVREEQPQSTQEKIQAVVKDLCAITRNALLRTRWVPSPESQTASREASYTVGDRTYTLAQLSKIGGEIFEPCLQIRNGQQVLEVKFAGEEGDLKSIYLITKTEGGSTHSVPLTEAAQKDDRVAALLLQKLETALAELGTTLVNELRDHHDLLKRYKEVREALDAVLFLEKI